MAARSAHKHHAYADVARQWKEFAYLLAAFAAKNGTPKPVDIRHAETARLQADISRTKVAAPKCTPHPRRSAAKRRKAAAVQLALLSPIAKGEPRTVVTSPNPSSLRTQAGIWSSNAASNAWRLR